MKTKPCVADSREPHVPQATAGLDEFGQVVKVSED